MRVQTYYCASCICPKRAAALQVKHFVRTAGHIFVVAGRAPNVLEGTETTEEIVSKLQDFVKSIDWCV